MARFNSRVQIQRAKDEDIEKFFAETIFEGVYSSEIKNCIVFNTVINCGSFTKT